MRLLNTNNITKSNSEYDKQSRIVSYGYFCRGAGDYHEMLRKFRELCPAYVISDFNPGDLKHFSVVPDGLDTDIPNQILELKKVST
mmetsp:Transcript_26682/g.22837  ORF Transcript_26682/g.22837 Transcript_26682/m.22837 type:complete len:86 (-) Transcript_26682:173-430(-)